MRSCEGAGCQCERSGECPVVYPTMNGWWLFSEWTVPYDERDAQLMAECADLRGRDAWARHYAYAFIGLSVDELVGELEAVIRPQAG